MKAALFISVVYFSFVSVRPATSAPYDEEHRAVAKLVGPNVSGNITFTQSGSILLISGVVEGLKPKSTHGFHIHEKGDLSSGCASTGGHFNPYNKHHGGPTDEERHVGDLGNIDANEHGVAAFTLSDHVASLVGPNCIIGRGVVLHSDPDDLGKGQHPDSLTTGHAGSRIACGVIGTLDPGTDKLENSASRSSPYFTILTVFVVFLKLTN
ncbi:superoxide dismutase [Cu-Zn] 2-like [Cimex lectularius]|uniref:Superoxide dismutase [Cu-Zn] n=1 Tax=Cimex lectularius TaxID=79782 RepID=A0A8I6RZP7_CIMLE|nr:superoxide dismutase [Cu-Zn] 2-like [Cimex lectularius]